MITLYDLAGAEEERRFSPYCWRVRMALLHKGLPFETRPWRFTEKDAIAFSGQGKVPVIVDGDRQVHDSWTIAEYLEETYPEAPSLFGGPVGKGLSRFVTDWAERVIHPAIFKFVAKDIYDHLHGKDKIYFRESREARIKMRLEAFVAGRDDTLTAFRRSLEPLRQMLKTQAFIAGAQPAWADYAVFGAFQWARCISPYPLLAAEDPVAAWRGRLLDAFGGAAGCLPGYPGQE